MYRNGKTRFERLVEACQNADPNMIPVAMTREEKMLKKVADSVCGGGGNSEVLNDILARTVTELTLEGVTSLGKEAFSSCTELHSVSLPDCESFGNGAFAYAAQLRNVDAPKVKAIDAYCFRNCTSLAEVNFPAVETIHSYSFSGCANIARVILPKMTGKFSSTYFANNKNLEYVFLPSVSEIGFGEFSGCSKLAKVDLTEVIGIRPTAFQNCTDLSAVIIRNTDAVCVLYGANAFSGTAVESGTGFVYVPDALVDSYKTAEEWSTFAAQIKPLSELDESTDSE